MTPEPHSDPKALAIATDLATHHRLCDSQKGGECDCYANAGQHYLGFAYLRLEEQLEATRSGGAGLIAAERQRQMASEGWTPEHDDRHDDGELARAACVYATDPDTRAEIMLTPDGEANVNVPGSGYEPRHWPWEGWWKPTPDDRVRELVKAGALIAAEIDRLQRASFPAKRPM